MVGRAAISTADKSKLLIGIEYTKEISEDRKDYIEQYYFMYAYDKYYVEIDYIFSKSWSSRKYNQIRKSTDKRFDFYKK